MQEFSRSLPMMLYRALDTVMPRFRRIFHEFGLTEPQWRVLRVLWERDKIALGELADLTLISAPSLVGIVDRLKASNLIARKRSKDDRRVLFVLATQKGRDLEELVMPKVREAYAELQQSVRADDWLQILNALETVSSLDLTIPANSTGLHEQRTRPND